MKFVNQIDEKWKIVVKEVYVNKHISMMKKSRKEKIKKKTHRILFSKFVIYTMFVIYCVSYNYL